MKLPFAGEMLGPDAAFVHAAARMAQLHAA